MTNYELRKLRRSDLVEIICKLEQDEKFHEDSSPSFSVQIEEERKKQERQKEYKRILLHTISMIVVAAALSVLLATRFLPVLQVSGVSMEPALKDGETVILLKQDKCKTGDLIGFYYQNKILLKRVIGKAGDEIDIDQNGTVYVNHQKREENYVKEKALGECDIQFPYQVPDGKLFVMGDCRSLSIDSRNTSIGCVAQEQVVGKVVFRIWPLERMGMIH